MRMRMRRRMRMRMRPGEDQCFEIVYLMPSLSCRSGLMSIRYLNWQFGMHKSIIIDQFFFFFSLRDGCDVCAPLVPARYGRTSRSLRDEQGCTGINRK